MLSVTHEQTNQQTEHPVISETSFESADNDLHAATACRVGLMCESSAPSCVQILRIKAENSDSLFFLCDLGRCE